MERLLLLSAILVVGCQPGPDRDEVFRGYVDAVNRKDLDAALGFHTPDAVFLIPGQDTIAGLDAMRRLLQWDSVLESSLRFGPSAERGDTLFVEGGSERSLWFAGIGIDSILYGPGIRVVFEEDLIAGIFPSALRPASGQEFERKLTDFLGWASTNAANELETLLPQGRFRYDGAAAASWLPVFDRYAATLDTIR